MFCPNCGSYIEDGAMFCGECGTKLDGSAAQKPPVAGPGPVQGNTPVAKTGMPKWLIPVLIVVGVLVIGVVGVFAFRAFSGNKDEDVTGASQETTTVEQAYADSTTVPEESSTTAEPTTVGETTTAPPKRPVSDDGGSKVVETKPQTTRAPETVAPPVDDGYDDGYNSGYDDGYNSGYDDGYNSGYDDSYDDGYDDSYDDDSYLYASYGYSLSEIESALTDYINTNDWTALSEYILPGSYEILEIMCGIEEDEGYDNYAYFYGVQSINRYYDNYSDIPYADEIYYEYHDLDYENTDYLYNTSWGLYEMAEYAFDEIYGGNMEFVSLSYIETFVIDSDGEDYGFYVFIIETDYGYFLLCV